MEIQISEDSDDAQPRVHDDSSSSSSSSDGESTTSSEEEIGGPARRRRGIRRKKADFDAELEAALQEEDSDEEMARFDYEDFNEAVQDAAEVGLINAAQHFFLQLMTQALLVVKVIRKIVKHRQRKQRRRWWVSPLLQQRQTHGHFHTMMPLLRTQMVERFSNFCRFSPRIFDWLLARLEPRLRRQDTRFRKALEPGLKLACTLRYLATGMDYRQLEYTFRCGHSTITGFIPEVCLAIVQEFQEEVMKTPSTPQEWEAVAEQFLTKWDLPNCIGALDGKHCAIRCPPRGGSLYYNYKHFHSIVLMALVDANYKFLYVNVGATGSGSDGGVFRDTELRRKLDTETAGLPPPKPFPRSDVPIPYYIVGDEAFALRTWLMKPYPRRNLDRECRSYNYRISRARRVVENAFGILCARFRALRKEFAQDPRRVELMVTSACILHNILRTDVERRREAGRRPHRKDRRAERKWFNKGRGMHDLGRPERHGNVPQVAKDMRNHIRDYVNGLGKMKDQDKIVFERKQDE